MSVWKLGSSIKADAARRALACLAAASKRGHQKFVILQPCMGSNPFFYCI